MTDGWFNRISTPTLSRLFSAVLLVATGLSISDMRAKSRLAADLAAARFGAAARTEAVMALSHKRGDALRAAMAGSTVPARSAAELRLAAFTRQWQAALDSLRAPHEGSPDALLVEELFAAASRVIDAQSDVLLALSRNDVAGAQRTYVERGVEFEGVLQASLGRLTASHRMASAAIAAELSERTRRLFLLLAAIVALVIAGGGIAGYGLIRRAARQESDLHRERSLSGMTLHSIRDGVVTVDAEGRVEFMNPVAESLTGWRIEDARQRPLAEVYALIDERSREVHCFAPWHASAVSQPRHEVEMPLRLASRDGREASVRHSFSQVVDLEGRSSGAIIVFRDDTGLRTLAHELSWQASHDALTGLPNRREFERTLTDLLATAASGRKTHALLCIDLDLDHSTAPDDSGGHAVGDELLCQLSTSIRAQMRSSDVLARLGGDQFGVLLESCPADQALRIASALRDAVNALVVGSRGQPCKVTAAIGLLPIDAASGSAAQVLAAADALSTRRRRQGAARSRSTARTRKRLVADRRTPAWSPGSATRSKWGASYFTFRRFHHCARSWRAVITAKSWCACSTRTTTCCCRPPSCRLPSATSCSRRSTARCCARLQNTWQGNSHATMDAPAVRCATA